MWLVGLDCPMTEMLANLMAPPQSADPPIYLNPSPPHIRTPLTLPSPFACSPRPARSRARPKGPTPLPLFAAPAPASRISPGGPMLNVTRARLRRRCEPAGLLPATSQSQRRQQPCRQNMCVSGRLSHRRPHRGHCDSPETLSKFVSTIAQASGKLVRFPLP